MERDGWHVYWKRGLGMGTKLRAGKEKGGRERRGLACLIHSFTVRPLPHTTTTLKCNITGT